MTLQLSTQALRGLLPYRHSRSPGFYQNLHNSGFGMQLQLPEPTAIQTIQIILQNLPAHWELQYSLLIHRHDNLPWQIYLFASITSTTPMSNILQNRQHLSTHLTKHQIGFKDLNSTDFLIFLRSVISPNRDSREGIALIDIHNQSFHEIIPKPGTRFTLSPQYIDIISANALGLCKTTRISINHIMLPTEHVALLECLHPLLQRQNQDYLLSFTFTEQHILANFVLFTSPEHETKERMLIHKMCADHGIELLRSTTPLHSFLTSLPFAKT
ncbi:MAG: hypothetical protein NTU48_05020 [Legionellales bacterium]|nr:hypothetical protein [Legionellales bacterium]